MTYTYDFQYRLTSESWPTDGVSGETRSYAFDLAGNRLKMVHTRDGITETTRYVYDDLNRLLSSVKESTAPDTDPVNTTYAYDLNGNRTGKTRAGQTDVSVWDVNDRLVQV